MVRLGWIAIALSLSLMMMGCDRISKMLPKPNTLLPNSRVHLLLGNPSNATTSLGSPDNYLLEKPQYVLSYNSSRGTPNWVSWQLNAQWLGSAPRRNDFRPDPSLPPGWYRVLPSDYGSSGYDRGHMAPSGDRTNTPEDNRATFLMTNILPQAPDNNQGPWSKLEDYCRSLARNGRELYIVAGGYGKKQAIAAGKVIPPSHTWKVIVVLDNPGDSIQSITDKTRVIAIDIPNKQGIRETDWHDFRVSVDKIEAATGYDLLSKVPEEIQRVVESRVDS